ncbi:hypothetical protein [uncultured Fibrobacter sp.]|uniref:hypothetical protein n=1 Tax=uncultured Fibrobacter sp. TaxID=261512 RepID=UPI0025D8DE34|nr:hypothetical protein [uncultured Fibrobacter sp.]
MKNMFWLLPLAALLTLTACDNDSSNNSEPSFEVVNPGNDGNNGGNNDGNKNKTGVEPGCNFVKTDNTWKYLMNESWGYIEVYIWTDETTVRHETHVNSFHDEDRDEILTDLNRDEFYDQIMAECQLMTSQNAE